MDLEKQKLELHHCGIEYIGETGPERASGKLGAFLFKWSENGYWIVDGRMPIRQAWRLHGHSCGDLIRVNGSCNRPAPEDPQVNYYTRDGRRVWLLVDKTEAEKHVRDGTRLEDSAQLLLNTCHFDDNRAGNPAYLACIELYHIDSELGLYVFAEMVRELMIKPQIDVNVELLKIDRLLKQICQHFDVPYPPKEE